MDLLHQYNEESTRKVPITELVSIANGVSLLRCALPQVEEGFSRTGGKEIGVYNLVEERMDEALREIPALVLRVRGELLADRADEIVSRAANIFAERWLHAHTPRYNYSDMQDLEWDLVDAIVNYGHR